jgi:23S rRNA (adenine2503-C2)-methyltransferase
MKEDLKTLTLSEIKIRLEEMGEKAYHARQLALWMYQRGIADFDRMTDLSQSCRRKLSEVFYISELPLIVVRRAEDHSAKCVFRLSDGFKVESVLIPDQDRLTLCISTQIGCRQGCRFCVTARMGFIRNLYAHEIVDQIIQVRKHLSLGERPFNVVLMGMGEPLDNYRNTVQAIRLMTADTGLNISPRRITLSTAGLVPQIYQLPKEHLGINLAVSVNAPCDTIRNLLMPINRRYNLDALMKSLREFPIPARRRITIEYILIEDLNDSPEAARQLGRMLHGIRCKVNLIPYNANPHLPYREPSEACLRQFQETLSRHYLTATIRRSKGRDVHAACGQLGYQYLSFGKARLTPGR